MYMNYFKNLLAVALTFFCSIEAITTRPEQMQKIMNQPKYRHSTWGLYVADSKTGEVLFDINSDQMFLPASTTKLFSVAALLHTYGDDYRFKTPLYAVGEIKNGTLNGNLILVAQGDLTMGGRQGTSDKISFSKLDHINANNVPGALLTKEEPLYAFTALAKQTREKGIKEINGDVIIDDRLFEITTKREMILSPMMVNENLIDIVLNPTEVGKKSTLSWRPQVLGYTVSNEVTTVSSDASSDITITSDASGQNIVVQGTIPAGQKDIVQTFPIKDPNHFARAALVQALTKEGIKILSNNNKPTLPSYDELQKTQPIATWTSPPLSEYAKLILKVSHNLGADLIPLLLAVKKGEKSFKAGMLELGHFIVNEAKVSPHSFVFIDGAGGDENRVTLRAEIELLKYIKTWSTEQFTHFYNALPILGVDGSLEDFGKETSAVGKVRAKPGTGVSFNLATNEFFLTTQALSGYVEGRKGQLLEYMLVVNNAIMPEIKDVFAIFEDQAQISGIIYDHSK